MNYNRIYDGIILKAKLENRVKLSKLDINYVYYENHHIIPKCLNGKNTKENLVLLKPREHFVVHKLLAHIHNNNIKLVRSFFMMSHAKRFSEFVSSKDYAYAKTLLHISDITDETRDKMINSAKNRNYTEDGLNRLKISLSNRIYTDETRKKLSERAKTFKHTKESKEKIRISHIGKFHTDETKLKISIKKSGKETWMKGKHHTDESKQKLSIAGMGRVGWNKGLALSDETKLKISKNRKNILHTEDTKLRMSESHRNTKKLVCPHCNKNIDPGNYAKHHGDKCKSKILSI